MYSICIVISRHIHSYVATKEFIISCMQTCKVKLPCTVFQAAPQLHDALELKLHINKHIYMKQLQI